MALKEKWSKPTLQLARQSWAFSKSKGDNIYSFTVPPSVSPTARQSRPWQGAGGETMKPQYFDGQDTRDIVSELLKRSLEFAFFRAGLLWCPDRELIYFNPKEHLGKRLVVKYPSGDGTNRAVCGEKHRWRPNSRGEDYSWQIAPDCRCYGSLWDPWEFRTRVMIRVTYRNGTPIEGKRVVTFRKHAANGWNQDKFRDLNLLFMQHIALDQFEISVGEGEDRVAINATPRLFASPVRIDEDALPKGASKFAKRSDRTEDEVDEEEFDA
ncbi:MAG: hypothetical protein R3C12_21575 [Planctomycetaceae bacterium]